jgi:16S rRNA (cytosine967-C5)-methyltransferase
MDSAQRHAARAVRRVLAGASLERALADDSSGGDRERAQVRDLAHGTLRHWSELDAIVRMMAERRPADASVEALLWVALYQLSRTSAPPAAVVDSAVRATVRLRKSSARGLTNAILRGFLRRRDAVLTAVHEHEEARLGFARWWIDRARTDWGSDADALLERLNDRPPLALRVNRRLGSREELLVRLAACGIDAQAAGESGIVLAQARPVGLLPGYDEGRFSVQDLGAQVAAPLLGARDGMRVLDACAAPGGKTSHLAELASLDLVAIDRDELRVERLRQNLARLDLHADVRVADAGAPSTWWDGVPFDRILVDAPCTSSGVVRRHPDIKWLRRESDVAEACSQQRRLLDALWPCLASGGRMLYATCSMFRAENHDQASAFVERHPDAVREPLGVPLPYHDLDGQLLPSAAGAAHNHDAFFYALLRKA